MKKTFYSNGKLLLTGEYLVLDGAKALAIPTRYGQYLYVEDSDSKSITWKSFDNDGSRWFEDEISFDDIQQKKQFKERPETNTLIKILYEASVLNPVILKCNKGFRITTNLTFPRNWGLGTSSTLINNIAQWFEIDAFKLLNKSFGGSGYDIACAQNNSPITYNIKNNIPTIEKITFKPDYLKNLYFIYLNKKQNSRLAIVNYNSNKNNLENNISEINNLTSQILKAKNLDTFCTLLEEHEEIISTIIKSKTVKELLFKDFNGTVKSLGAWGGDFILAACDTNPEKYFEEKGYPIIIPYKDMIL